MYENIIFTRTVNVVRHNSTIIELFLIPFENSRPISSHNSIVVQISIYCLRSESRVSNVRIVVTESNPKYLNLRIYKERV